MVRRQIAALVPVLVFCLAGVAGGADDLQTTRKAAEQGNAAAPAVLKQIK